MAFKSKLQNLDASDITELRVYDSQNRADYFDDAIGQDGKSGNWSMMYTSGLAHDMLSTAERTTVLGEYHLNAIDPSPPQATQVPPPTTQMSISSVFDDITRKTVEVRLARWASSDLVTNFSWQDEYRAWLRREFGSGATAWGIAATKGIDVASARNICWCSQSSQWPLYYFAWSHALPVSFSSDDSDTAHPFFRNWDVASQPFLGFSTTFAPGHRTSQIAAAVRALAPDLSSTNLLNWKFDPDPSIDWYDAFSPLSPHNTNSLWGVTDVAQLLSIPSVGSDLLHGVDSVSSVRVGDVVCQVGIAGWPGTTGPLKGAQHSDVITDMELQAGALPNLYTRVRLLISSAEAAARGESGWFPLYKLLSRRTAPNNDAHKMTVIRSLDYVQFDLNAAG